MIVPKARSNAFIDQALTLKFQLLSIQFTSERLLLGISVSQHAINRFFRGERIHPGTRQKLAQAVEKLERDCL